MPKNRAEVSICCGGEGEFSGRGVVSGFAGEPKRVLRLSESESPAGWSRSTAVDCQSAGHSFFQPADVREPSDVKSAKRGGRRSGPLSGSNAHAAGGSCGQKEEAL